MVETQPTSHASPTRTRVGLLTGLLGSALLALLAAAPALPSPRTVTELADWLAVTPADQVVTGLAAMAAWLCLCWLAGSAVFVALGQLPGWWGRHCRAVGGVIAPALLRRLLEGLLGTALASGSLVTALPAAAAPVAVSSASISTAWYAAADAVADSAVLAPDGWPDLDRPNARRPASTASPSRSPSRSPSGSPSRSPGGAPPSATTDAGATDAVTVRPGDTLWGLAGRALGDAASPAEVAAAWPRWYAANRRVIGSNPDRLQPGQTLQPPP